MMPKKKKISPSLRKTIKIGTEKAQRPKFDGLNPAYFERISFLPTDSTTTKRIRLSRLIDQNIIIKDNNLQEGYLLAKIIDPFYLSEHYRISIQDKTIELNYNNLQEIYTPKILSYKQLSDLHRNHKDH